MARTISARKIISTRKTTTPRDADCPSELGTSTHGRGLNRLNVVSRETGSPSYEKQTSQQQTAESSVVHSLSRVLDLPHFILLSSENLPQDSSLGLPPLRKAESQGAPL